MELRDYLSVLGRRWLVIVTSVLVVVAVAAVVTARTTPLYQSNARLFISTPEQSTSDALQGGNFAIQRVSSYADLVTGQELASRVIRALDLDLTPGEMSQKIDATVVEGTVILEISATDPDPRTAQEIAGSVAEELIGFVGELETPADGSTAPIKATVIDAASLPTSIVSPQPVRNLGLALVLGLLLGIVLAAVRELLDTSLRSADDIAELTDAPVLGSIVADSSASRRPLLSDLPPSAPRAEGFRILRANLQFVLNGASKKVLVVTSPAGGEGRTSTASNIALALQAGGQRTLLVDGDLRSPELADLFALEGSVGMTSVLLGRVELGGAVQEHVESGLAVLVSGTLPASPADLLQPGAIDHLLDHARTTYDVVVIDAPALLPSADASLLAARADGAVIVVRQGKTTRDQLVRSIERLASVGVRPLGFTVNRVAKRGGPARWLSNRRRTHSG